MDLKKLTEMAQQQRTAEEETTQLITPTTKPELEPIYVPIEDDEPEQIPEDGYTPAETEDNPTEEPAKLPDSLEGIIAYCFPEEKAYNIELERLLPFRSPVFSADGDLSALKSSIARVGVTEPLLVRSAGNGEYEILAGHRRKSAAESLMWTKVPCRIADNDKLSDEYAGRIVVESNRQRFPALKLSEQIRVSAILGERAIKELSITPEQAQRFSRLDRLEQNFLEMLDSGVLSTAIASTLSALDKEAQKILLNVLEQHPEMKLTAANAKELSAAAELTEDSISEILKPKPPINIAIPAEIIDEYLPGRTCDEISDFIVKMICRFFEVNTNVTNQRHL